MRALQQTRRYPGSLARLAAEHLGQLAPPLNQRIMGRLSPRRAISSLS
jgi:hypothetical protein